MNYSKKGIEYKLSHIKSTSRRMVSKLRIAIFHLFVVSIVGIAIIGSYAVFGFVNGLIDSAPDISQIDVIPQGYTTKVRDREGNIIEYLVAANSNREYVYLKDLPDYIKYCFISIEDERFYEHSGIDIRGIFRAGFVGITSGDFSGSQYDNTAAA